MGTSRTPGGHLLIPLRCKHTEQSKSHPLLVYKITESRRITPCKCNILNHGDLRGGVRSDPTHLQETTGSVPSLVERLHDLTSAPKSRLTGDCHARFREGLGVKSPPAYSICLFTVFGRSPNHPWNGRVIIEIEFLLYFDIVPFLLHLASPISGCIMACSPVVDGSIFL